MTNYSTWTDEEQTAFRILRQEEREKGDRERKRWQAAGPDFTDSETVYVIEYRERGVNDEDEPWLGCSPFFDPIRLRPEETHSRDEAEEVARRLLNGEHPTNRGALAMKGIGAVRIIERVSSATIIAQFTRTYEENGS